MGLSARSSGKTIKAIDELYEKYDQLKKEESLNDTHKTYNVELDVYFWDDDSCMVYTSGGTFSYSEVIPNDDFSKVVVIYEW